MVTMSVSQALKEFLLYNPETRKFYNPKITIEIDTVTLYISKAEVQFIPTSDPEGGDSHERD